ncbi:TnsA endonuclease N-terminal domain-containing protein [Aestuariirhabdus litorea]|uniref:TnsA endonuclease N-terminal domain-containing protein n=1 Tax=Aestuariirhabdus litorea TaxID=2528527 RepID=A0A3P3VJU4_9GAMM|nr:TnsA endonuclease N-terminal domain-containing protein [Aestuariirhabdus litorea]RRJ82597.1 hypothetical protein D0544_12080 [Aestuariirhabdus litorea]RWW92756.1 hypothetical protein DZC74_12055 [Endozoicomonadaceae bacterium GTF-13]
MAIQTHEQHSGRKVMSVSRLTTRVLTKLNNDPRVSALESRLQYHWGLYLWRCSDVVEILEEAGKFRVPMWNKTITYYPDFQIVLSSGAVVYLEIKPKREAEKEEIKVKHKAIGEYLNKQGYQFFVLTEEELPLSNVGVANTCRLKLVHTTRRRTLEELCALLPKQKTTFGELSKKLGWEVVMEMMAAQLLGFDWNREIKETTELTYMEGDRDVQFISA